METEPITVTIPNVTGLEHGSKQRNDAIAQAIASATGFLPDFKRMDAHGDAFARQAARRSDKWRKANTKDFAFLVAPSGDAWSLTHLALDTVPEDGHYAFVCRATIAPCSAGAAMMEKGAKRSRTTKHDAKAGADAQSRTRIARYQADALGSLTIVPRFAIPTATALMYRLCIYQATDRPTRCVDGRGKPVWGEWFSTSWGRARVRGCLGQRHADLMECIARCAIADRVLTGGGVEYVVDPAALKKLMSRTKNGYGGEPLERLLDDLWGSDVEIEAPGLRVKGRFFDQIADADAVRNPLGGTRALRAFRLGAAYVALLTDDINLMFDPAPVRALRCGITKAIARHLKTHRGEPAGGWKLDGLIEAVSGAAVDGDALRNRRREVKRDAQGLLAAGFRLDGDRLHRADAAAPECGND